MISVIIPALNEEDNIGRCIEALAGECGCEVIVVDGGSADRTAEIASRCDRVKVIGSGQGRGIQMNSGAAAASGDILLFLHADTVLEKGWAGDVCSALEDADTAGGALTFAIESREWRFRFIEHWVRMRSDLFRLPYGDQAIFTRKGLFDEIGGYRNIPLMEDVDLVGRLKKRGRMAILKKRAFTSDRRWRERGVIRTAALNQLIMLLYICGVDPVRLAKLYYR